MGLIQPRRLSRAANPRASRIVLAAYLWHPLPWVARVAAVNPRTPRRAFRWASGQARLRDVVLQDTRTSNDALRRYAAEPDMDLNMLQLIARHPNSDAETLRAIAAHRHATYPALAAVIQNPACPVDVLLTVVQEAERADGAASTDRQSCRLQEMAASREDAPAEMLTWLAHHCDDDSVLQAVAGHTNTPEADAVVAALKLDFNTVFVAGR